MNSSQIKSKLTLHLLLAVLAALALYLIFAFAGGLPSTFADLMTASLSGKVFSLLRLALWLVLVFSLVRIASFFLFDYLYPKRRGVNAPELGRNIFALVCYTILFALVFKQLFPELSLGALFTTSAVFGVIIGLALQDTLGNLFAGISLQADKPFLVGDVITVGIWSGVVESITWRGVKIRTFQNHIVIISNASVAKESIEVCPRDNLNARLVFFNALYTNSPAQVIDTVREAVRETENVARSITPIVRIRGLGDSGVDYEVKYWLKDYARYNDTDALVRQRIWYAFGRAELNFAYPTRTLYVERKKAIDASGANGDSRDHRKRVERLAAVDIFTPLTAEELSQLAFSAESRTFAPGESIIHAGDAGSSMFVVHRGAVKVRVQDGDADRLSRTVATLEEGDFFGEMALFTGEPRTANVVAAGETEVLEIGHEAIKRLFDTNPNLVESLSQTIAERRAELADEQDRGASGKAVSAGLLSSIRRFFRIK